MDNFGVLVENYGIKRQGKSAPMAASRTATRTTTTTHNYNSSAKNVDPPFGTKPFSNSTQNSSSVVGSFLDHQNDPFGFSFTHHKPQNYGGHDVFDSVPVKNSSSSNGGGGGFDFDMETVFKGSVNLNANSSSDVNDDVIWGVSGNGSAAAVAGDSNDLLSSDPVDDFLGNLGKLGSDRGKKLDKNKGTSVDSDDLIPGFGSNNVTNDRAQASSTKKSAGISSLDELEDFATGKIKRNSDEYLDDFSNFLDVDGNVDGAQASSPKKSAGFSSFDELEDFATGKIKKNGNVHLDAFTAKNEPKKTFEKSQETNFFDVDGDNVHQTKAEMNCDFMFQEEATDLDSFFRAHVSKSVPVSKETSASRETEEVPDMFSGNTFSPKKKIPQRPFPDDLTAMFGGPPVSDEFEEIEGETAGRRKLRFERYQRSKARQAHAKAEMNQREYKAQQEQEEKHRIAEAFDMEMKRWAAGKEGNLRALLSSLQQVLGPEFGWRPVTLTDLITSSQVKIAYKKAALCIHPDKVQQRGCSLQQKFVAEKAFDLLKEAWNKFNSEELR